MRSQIENSDNEAQTGTCGGLSIHREGGPGLRGTPAGETDETHSARKGNKAWDKHVSYLCYYKGESDIMLRMLRGEYHYVIQNPLRCRVRR